MWQWVRMRTGFQILLLCPAGAHPHRTNGKISFWVRILLLLHTLPEHTPSENTMFIAVMPKNILLGHSFPVLLLCPAQCPCTHSENTMMSAVRRGNIIWVRLYCFNSHGQLRILRWQHGNSTFFPDQYHHWGGKISSLETVRVKTGFQILLLRAAPHKLPLVTTQ